MVKEFDVSEETFVMAKQEGFPDYKRYVCPDCVDHSQMTMREVNNKSGEMDTEFDCKNLFTKDGKVVSQCNCYSMVHALGYEELQTDPMGSREEGSRGGMMDQDFFDKNKVIGKANFNFLYTTIIMGLLMGFYLIHISITNAVEDYAESCLFVGIVEIGVASFGVIYRIWLIKKRILVEDNKCVIWYKNGYTYLQEKKEVKKISEIMYHIYSGEMEEGSFMSLCDIEITILEMARNYDEVTCAECLKKRIDVLDDGHEHNKKSVAILKKMLNKLIGGVN
ncbi:hypothetical protein KAU43_07485 [candidate division WOR-3 bacterium]|nr:hypothetical protein [candidate division WOR-3 bacterium]